MSDQEPARGGIPTKIFIGLLMCGVLVFVAHYVERKVSLLAEKTILFGEERVQLTVENHHGDVSIRMAQLRGWQNGRNTVVHIGDASNLPGREHITIEVPEARGEAIVEIGPSRWRCDLATFHVSAFRPDEP